LLLEIATVTGTGVILDYPNDPDARRTSMVNATENGNSG
jgi:hypothetical protein